MGAILNWIIVLRNTESSQKTHFILTNEELKISVSKLQVYSYSWLPYTFI